MKQLLFIYNADSGKGNALLDYGKKYITPNRYDCQLCMVSYGPFGMKQDWKSFVADLPLDVVFLHRNEYTQKYPKSDISLPALIYEADDQHQVLMQADDFDTINSLDDLQNAVKAALGKIVD